MKMKKVWILWMLICCMFADCFLSYGVVYAKTDGDSFLKEHKNELREYQNEFKDDLEEKNILLWTYPFSGETTGEIKDSFGHLSFKYLYLDTEGNQDLWGYLDDGKNKGWICFNEPDRADLRKPDTNMEEGKKTPVKEADKRQQNAVVLVVMLVLALAAVTGIIIAKFWKRKE